jgi:hypothetical protein
MKGVGVNWMDDLFTDGRNEVVVYQRMLIF